MFRIAIPALPEGLREQLRLARSGRVIPIHRGLGRLRHGFGVWAQVVLLPLFLVALYLSCLPIISHLWNAFFASLIDQQTLTGSLSATDLLPVLSDTPREGGLSGRVLSLPLVDALLNLSLPRLDTVSYLPDNFSLIVTAVLVVVLSVAAGFLSDRMTPLKYFVRFLCLTQAIACVFFFFSSRAYGYPLTDYLSDMLRTTVFIVLFTPLVLTAIYFIFDFSLGRKLLFGLGIMLYLLLLAPFQYAAHVWLLQQSSMLFHPLLFIVFGPFLQVLIMIAAYGWAMSWRRRGDNDEFGVKPA